jgi:hypothetical protein
MAIAAAQIIEEFDAYLRFLPDQNGYRPREFEVISSEDFDRAGIYPPSKAIGAILARESVDDICKTLRDFGAEPLDLFAGGWGTWIDNRHWVSFTADALMEDPECQL